MTSPVGELRRIATRSGEANRVRVVLCAANSYVEWVAQASGGKRGERLEEIVSHTEPGIFLGRKSRSRRLSHVLGR
jgi:hypothetical protein